MHIHCHRLAETGRWLVLALLTVSAVAATALAPAPAAAQDAGAWSMEEYTRLSSEMEAADEERTLAVEGTDGWRQATLAAIDARRVLIAFISRSVRDRSIPAEFVEPAAAARLLLIENVVVLLSDLHECSQAEAAVRLLDDTDGSSSDEVQAARETAQRAVDRCVDAAPVATAASPAAPPTPTPAPVDTTPAPQAQAPDTAAAPAPTTAPPPVATPARSTQPEPARASGGGGRTAGIALMAIGGGLAAGGLILDAVNASGPRSEFTELSNQCPDNCDTARLNELSDQINGAKAPIGALLFGGIGLGVTGAVVYAISPRAADRVAVAPQVGRGYQGAVVRVRW